MHHIRVTVIGAGLAGLSAASYLRRNNVEVTIIDKNPRIGGMLSTESIKGFFLDRGFHPVLDNFPELNRIINVRSLHLREFAKGFSFIDSEFSHDDFSIPQRGDSFSQYLKILKMLPFDKTTGLARRTTKTLLGSARDGLNANFTTTKELLEQLVVRESKLHGFFRALNSALLLDPECATPPAESIATASLFVRGQLCIPDTGIAELPSQIASSIPLENFRLDSEVVSVSDSHITLATRETIEHDYTIVTVAPLDLPALNFPFPEIRYLGYSTHYFATESAITTGAMIQVPIFDHSKIISTVVLDEVSALYAPRGVHLISVTTKSEHDAKAVLGEAASIFGIQQKDLDHINSYQLNYGVPSFTSRTMRAETYNGQRISNKILLAGDYLLGSSLDLAIKSGRLAAQNILMDAFNRAD